MKDKRQIEATIEVLKLFDKLVEIGAIEIKVGAEAIDAYKESIAKRKYKTIILDSTATFTKLLPREYIGELEALQRRWQKQKLSNKKIKFKTYLCLLNMIRAYIQCQIENLWLGFVKRFE
jgi:hypothetical protein